MADPVEQTQPAGAEKEPVDPSLVEKIILWLRNKGRAAEQYRSQVEVDPQSMPIRSALTEQRLRQDDLTKPSY